MAALWLVPLLCSLLCGFVWAAPTSEKAQLELAMPKVRPTQNDEVLCHAKKVTGPLFITSYIPKANMATAHHILVYGCTAPGKQVQKAWNCGEMEKAQKDEFKAGRVCKGGKQHILYAWAMDAPALHLPEGIGFPIGGNTGLDYLVLQVHYKNVSKFKKDATATDNSAVVMEVQTEPTPKIGGVYLLLTGGVIPPQSIVHMETACRYSHKVTLHPFAYRTHAHNLGQVVSGYRVRNGKWTEIGRKSPHLPQMFYNVTHSDINVKPGDWLAARCVMKNEFKEKTVSIGNTQKDEMCNFYMMFWVPAKDAAVLEEPDMNYCTSGGWPSYKWVDQEGLPLKGLPKTASMIPGSKQDLKENVDRKAFVEASIAEAELEWERDRQEVLREIQAAAAEEEAEEEAEAEAEARQEIVRRSEALEEPWIDEKYW